MKKFNDLVFEPHQLSMGHPNHMSDPMGFRSTIHSKMTFYNGNTISVIGGGPLYGDGIETFEVMDHEGEVHGYLSKHEVTEIMIKSQGVLQLGNIKKHKMI